MSETGYESLYNERILGLAGSLNKDDRLADPQATAQVDSPLCGSRIRVDVVLDEDGRVAQFGQQVRACALGQSSAAILKAHVLGHGRDELAEVLDTLEAMLKREGAPPQGEWSDLAVLEPARTHKSRHASILLPFRAVVKAMDMVLADRAEELHG